MLKKNIKPKILKLKKIYLKTNQKNMMLNLLKNILI